NHRRFIIRAELTSPDSKVAAIEFKPIDDFDRFHRSTSDYETQQWNIAASQGHHLLKNIREDQQHLIQYEMTGSQSFLSFFKGGAWKEFESCVRWCKKQLLKLEDPRMRFEDRWYHFFALPPQAVTRPASEKNSSQTVESKM